MYDIFSEYWVSCQELRGFHYRVDSRPPSVIMQQGFVGTNSLKHCFASFEYSTVFCSSSIAGSIAFKNSAQNAGIKLPYSYQINATDLRGYKFHNNTNHLALAKILFERNASEYYKKKRYQKGHDEFIDYLASKLRSSINEAFLPIEEVHIQGPIPPEKIFYIPNLLRNEV